MEGAKRVRHEDTQPPSLQLPTKKAKKEVKYRKYVFTTNNPTLTPAEFQEALMALKPSRYIFSLESAPTTGLLHYQGYIEFAAQKTKAKLDAVVQWSESARGDVFDNKAYSSKKASHVDGPWMFNMPEVPPPLLTGMEGHELYFWQKHIMQMVSVPCTEFRNIWWFWSSGSQFGKSTFTRYLFDNMEGVLPSQGKKHDVTHAIAKFVAPKKGLPKPLRVLLIDHPRVAAALRLDDLESYKGRYPQVHLLVLANYKPRVPREASGRWHFVNVALPQNRDGPELVIETPESYDESSWTTTSFARS